MDNQEQAKLQQEVSQSNKASTLLEDPLLKDSFDKLKNLYCTSLLNTGVNENETPGDIIIEKLSVFLVFKDSLIVGQNVSSCGVLFTFFVND